MRCASLACVATMLSGGAALHLKGPSLLPPQPAPSAATPPRAIGGLTHLSRGLPALAPAAVLSLLSPLVAHAEEASSALAASSTPFLSLPSLGFTPEESSALLVFAAQTVISWGIPATVVLTLVVLTARGPSEDEEPELPPKLAKALGLTNEPKEFLKVERLNDKLQSFTYSMEKASTGKATALRRSRQRSFARSFGAELAAMDLTTTQLKRIETAAQRYQESLATIEKRQEKSVGKLRAMALGGGASRAAPAADEEKSDETTTPEETAAHTTNTATANTATTNTATRNGTNPIAAIGDSFRAKRMNDEAAKLYSRRLALDQQLLSGLAAELGPQRAQQLAELIQDKSAAGGVLEAFRGVAAAATAGKRVFVLKFFGDVTASQVSNLRQEVTAVLGNAAKGDQVVIVLNSGGGTVTGYGLAAAQLTRRKKSPSHSSLCLSHVLSHVLSPRDTPIGHSHACFPLCTHISSVSVPISLGSSRPSSARQSAWSRWPRRGAT